MKRKFTFLTAALALLAFLAIPVGMWGQTTVIYAQSSTSEASVQTGTAPTGSSVAFTTTYNNMNQLTGGNSMTLTLSGYAGQKITGITLSMRSNASKGAGSLSVTAGSTTIASIADANFNTNSWYGSWSSSYVDVVVPMTDDSYVIQDNENVTITIAATQNSLYCNAFKITYETGGESTDPTITVADATATVPVGGDAGDMAITCANLEISGVSDFAIQFYDDEDNELNGNNVPSWIEASVESQGEGYQVSYTVEANEGPARTAYFKVFAEGDSDFVYSNLVTISQDDYVIPVASGWELTDLADLTEDDIFVIVGTVEAGSFALPSESVSSPNAPAAMAITVTDGGTLSGEPADELKWNLEGNATDGYTFYVNGNHDKWLYCNTTANTSSNNNIKVGGGGNTNRNVFILDKNNYLVTNDNNVDRYLSIYVNGSTAQDWRGYINTNSAAEISFYKKVDQSADECTLVVPGYSGEGGYRLIASPITVDPSTVDGLTSGTYDLYRFDQSKDLEWRNYKSTPFYLIPGKGYLYAKAGNNDFNFILSGVAYDGDGQVSLSYTEGANWAGWNLIGNPFNADATIPGEISYYTMNEDGSDLILGESHSVGAMEGIFVLATGTEQSVTFTQGAKANAEHNARLVLNLNSNSKLIDRAIVRFGEGQTLPKFMLNEAHTKLYFTQNGTDYAVVRSEGEGEMPINFKAEHNGTYTIGISAKDMEFSRLRLIDNMTGADIDLLATPSYTFEAKTTDYASRFRLVFSSTGIEENENANFAYYNGSEWVINATENATVEVIDMMGRVIRVCTGGVHTLSTNGMASGVYMMRLIDGNNVKTQKIVVR